MFDWVAMTRSALAWFSEMGQNVKMAVLNAAMTMFMFCIMFAMWNIYMVGGNVALGLSNAISNPLATISTRSDQAKSTMMQVELKEVARSEALISKILHIILDQVPTASRVRLALIHNGISGLTGISMLRFDIINEDAAPGHAPGILEQNQPLSQWADPLKNMLSGNCYMYYTDKDVNAASRARSESLNIRQAYACPVTDPLGQMLGGLFVSWDNGSPVPTPQMLIDIDFRLKLATAQIATALDLRIK